MKKLFAAFLAGTMAFTAFGLTACGDNNDNDDKDKDETPEPEVADVQAPAYADGEWEMKIDLNSVMTGNAGTVSSDLFGLFLEDINYASFALDDNLIVNGSFETLTGNTTGGTKYGWTEKNATIAVAHDANVALHAQTDPNYANITSQAGGSISNGGHEEVPVAVSSGKDYSFSMFIKNYAGDVTVRVLDNTDQVYAESTFTVAESAEWTKYVKTVRADRGGDENLRVEISFSAADSFQIDAVQFETPEATNFGIKNYMYKAIADLSPKFFRFPGGCVIEGTNLSEAYDWKNSIGAETTGENAGDDALVTLTYPVNDNGETKTVTTYGEEAVRKHNTNIWQGGSNYYDHEYGVGFYEYFCLCDALGAKAIPIVNCGMSCQTQGSGIALTGRHGKGIEDYIQDAIDLLEFAKGATSTKWGGIREKLGHPEPFEMDYIGVGNEQWNAYYTQYYEKFLQDDDFQAALAKYNVKPIVGNWVGLGDCENWDGEMAKGTAQKAAIGAKARGTVDTIADYGVVDHHYYVNYTDFFTHTKMYDSYARPDDKPDDYYDVFVGEYAANTDTPVTGGSGKFAYKQNNWISALSEAAMMTGFERNGDIVKLAAYAPMFGVADKGQSAQQAGRGGINQWNAANMMYFTNTYVVLTPSYFVQQLFMQNFGTKKVASELSFAAGGAMPQTTVGTGSATRTYDNLYYVTSYDETSPTHDLVVKIVNAGNSPIKCNVNTNISGVTLTGIAQVTKLENKDPNATSTYYGGNAIEPKTQKIGFENNAFGLTLEPYSVVAVRIRTV